MAVKFRDYYEVLGVPRDASEDDIRKAFRKLARKYHPDVAEDKEEGEEKFKEINKAWEVLSDPEKRKKYDALGENWQHMGDFTPPPGGGFAGFDPGAGGYQEFHFEGTGFSDFFENLFGSRRGGGFADMSGFGRATARSMRGSDVEADILVTLEETMAGSERALTLQRPGSSESRTVRIRIPKGISEGQLIRCAGLGEPGSNGAESGDLYLRVRLERHPEFRVVGSDLYYDVRLAPWEAVLGTTVEVRTLHGPVKIRIPENTESGTEFRIRAKGLPREGTNTFGDLYAVATIVTPEVTEEEEKELWKRLAAKSQFNPRTP